MQVNFEDVQRQFENADAPYDAGVFRNRIIDYLRMYNKVILVNFDKTNRYGIYRQMYAPLTFEKVLNDDKVEIHVFKRSSLNKTISKGNKISKRTGTLSKDASNSRIKELEKENQALKKVIKMLKEKLRAC